LGCLLHAAFGRRIRISLSMRAISEASRSAKLCLINSRLLSLSLRDTSPGIQSVRSSPRERSASPPRCPNRHDQRFLNAGLAPVEPAEDVPSPDQLADQLQYVPLCQREAPP